ncbi:hypothetical protein ACIROD_09185 [Peribacillus sp. NPDC101481]|jgi:hypothetical protein|uniref:hypothetical protein n=2 Tax=Bacillales TaxID=1385 RepID=UPI000C32584A|nr:MULTISPECIES: hypothetical protein [Bacillaceae]PKF89765.1 hypothetical protein CW306_10800 [Bacillus sp. BA3]CAH0287388.1 hypothetical protein SRABI134_04218 [Peribacillus sp. Bi134]
MILKRRFRSIGICIFTLSIFLTGCMSGEKEVQKEMQKQTNTSTKDETDKKETGQEKTVSGVSIGIEEALQLEHPDQKGKKVLQLQLKATNKTAEEKFVDVFEMSVWNQEDKKLRIYPGDNLGTKLAPGKSVKGNGYYVIEGKGPYKVQYENTETKDKQEWTINKVKDMTEDESEK